MIGAGAGAGVLFVVVGVVLVAPDAPVVVLGVVGVVVGTGDVGTGAATHLALARAAAMAS